MPRFNFGFNLSLDFDDIQATRLFGSSFVSESGVAFTDNNAGFSTIVIRRVPEPASLAILGSALGLFLFARRLRRRRA
jgi:hypothetical protein